VGSKSDKAALSGVQGAVMLNTLYNIFKWYLNRVRSAIKHPAVLLIEGAVRRNVGTGDDASADPLGSIATNPLTNIKAANMKGPRDNGT
jgi:hypothetical protein